LLTGDRTTVLAKTPLPRLLMKCFALYVPLRWPTDLPTTPDLDQSVGGTRPTNFSADVADLERLLKQVASAGGGLAGQLHPLFGPMSESAWLRWAYLHADHHLRQFGA
jgi:hypothetical protein